MAYLVGCVDGWETALETAHLGVEGFLGGRVSAAAEEVVVAVCGWVGGRGELVGVVA